MLVFTDFHHASLLNSLILLFEKRLQGQLFRPIGLDWHSKGYWRLADHPATAEQFLGMGQASTPVDGTERLNEVVDKIDGVYYCHDIGSHQTNKAITLDTFMRLPIDIVIASVPQHLESFLRLCDIHPNKPKFIFQVGNAWNLPPINSDPRNKRINVLASAKIPEFQKQGYHVIEYHQEFNREIYRAKTVPEPGNKISSFVNCFNTDGLFMGDWALFQEVERLMPEWEFKSYGGQCRDGAAHGDAQVAEYMHDAKFIWHTKASGDGYGHVIHSAAACGRPLIAKKSYYLGKLAEPLIKDGETAITIDGLSPTEIKNKIEHFSKPEEYSKLVSNTIKNFDELVDFDREYFSIREFVENLL